MTEEEKTTVVEETPAPQEEAPVQEPAAEQAEPKKKRAKKSDKELEALQEQLAAEQDKYLRMAAEYDNYRKRSMKEKDHIYNDGVADTLTKFLPIYDNLERALQQQTADEAYKKGVEMIMTAMKETLSKCGVTVFGEVGETFDPALHNAVMHVEDEAIEESTVVEVFQKGFTMGEKVLRFSMVKVAN